MRTFWWELRRYDALYALEGALPLWAVRLIPVRFIDLVNAALDRCLGKHHVA